MFFIVYYIQFLCIVKLFYCNSMNIPFLREYMVANPKELGVTIVTVIFGSDLKPKALQELQYCANLLFCFIMTQTWRLGKWAQIREFLNDVPEEMSAISKYLYYTRKHREIKNKEAVIKEYFKQNSKAPGNARRAKKSLKKVDLLSSMKEGIDVYMPTILIWYQRILLGFQIYMYHNSMSMFHLVWLLFSFIAPQSLVFFSAVVIMLPAYTSEFFFIYGNRIAYVRESAFFQNYGGEFNWELRYPVLEQFLYYSIMTNFFMMISAMYVCVSFDQNERLISRFVKAVQNPRGSPLWIMFFYVAKYSHSLVLFCLLVRGLHKVDHFLNLGYILFFVVYTANEGFYRKSSRLLTVFISFFILLQFYFGLQYNDYKRNKR